MLIIYAGLWTYTLFQGDTASWFLTYFFSFILLLLFLSSIYPLKAWKVNRSFVKNTYHDGDLIDMQVSFTENRVIRWVICYSNKNTRYLWQSEGSPTSSLSAF